MKTIFSAWVLALIATLGSLFFSEVMKFPPCVLCWYQRICMYPLVVLFLVGMFPVSKSVIKFTTPLIAIGWIVALYHNLLYYKILPHSSSPCQQGVSCTSVHLEWLGFITIPLLSLVAFTLMAVLMFLTNKELKNEK